MHHLKNFFSLLVYSLLYAISLLPMRLLYCMSDFFYFIAYYVVGYRQSVIVQNLSRAFPDKKYSEIKEISRKFTRHLVDIFIEMLKSFSASQPFLEQRVSIVNPELVTKYCAQNRNIYFMLGHYGNWELLNTLPLKIDYPMYAIYKKQRGMTSNLLSSKIRTRFGMGLLPSKESAHFILRNKNTPAIYLFLADQSPKPGANKNFLFLNQVTTAFAGAEKLSDKTNAAVLYMEVMPQAKRGYTQIRFTDITDSDSVTEAFLMNLEKSINKAPQYWLWSHKRWKHEV